MVVGTHTKDFAEQNPQLMTTVRDFADLYKQNSKDVASRVLWSAFFVAVLANDKNPYKNYKDDEERREKIKELFCTSYSQKYLSLEKIFARLVLSKEHTLYNIHLRKYEEFVAEFDGLVLSSDDGWKKYLDATAKLEKITKFYDDLEKKFSESALKTPSKEGGGSFTAAEKRNHSNIQRN